MSLHHPKTVHGSGINHSKDRRIGFVIQSYIGTNVKQVLGKNGVQIARGEVVMVGERFGVRFTEVANPEDTVKKL